MCTRHIFHYPPVLDNIVQKIRSTLQPKDNTQYERINILSGDILLAIHTQRGFNQLVEIERTTEKGKIQLKGWVHHRDIASHSTSGIGYGVEKISPMLFKNFNVYTYVKWKGFRGRTKQCLLCLWEELK